MYANGPTDSRRKYSIYTVNILFILFSLIGLALIARLTVKLNPGRSSNALTISYTYPGAAPQVVEHQVTSVLEGACATLDGVSHIESNSSQGYGNITLEAEKNTDLQILRFQLLSTIKDVWQHLPEGVGYPEISNGRQGNAERQLLLSYTLNSRAGTFELQQYAEQFLKPEMGRTPDISGVEVYGATPREWQMKYNRALLKRYNIKPDELIQALYTWQQEQGVGSAVSYSSTGYKLQLPVSLSYSANGKEDDNWRNIPIRNLNGTIIRLGDVADRQIVEQKPTSYFRINGLNTITISVYAGESSNQIALADKLYKTQKRIQASLPAGYTLIKMYDSSEYLREEISKTTGRVVASLVLLMLLVLVVHRSLRYLALIAISLAANLAIAVIFYYLSGVGIHLVSIAGITVSIGIVIDNYIMMADFMLYRKSMRIYTAMLGATLSTLGALVVIFFLDETDRTNLVDFALVVIINLTVSLIVALFFIPSLMSGLRIKKAERSKRAPRLRRIWRLNKAYAAYIRFACRWRWALVVVALLAFGFPVHLLPSSFSNDSHGARLYNATLGSSYFQEHIRNPLQKLTGGTLSLFMQHATSRSNFYRPTGESTLYIRISLPTGTTIEQLNTICMKMESYLRSFPAIKQFQTSISGPQDAVIVVYFSEETGKTAEPEIIKSFMIQKAYEFAGADFGIYMRNESFSNELSEGWRMSRIQLSGYNYRELIALAQQVSDSIVLNPRINNIAVFSGSSFYNEPATIEEKGLWVDKARLASAGIGYLDFAETLHEYNAGPSAEGTIKQNGQYVAVKAYADDLDNLDLWRLMNTRINIDSTVVSPADVSSLTSMRVDGNIYKKDQSYLVTVAYDFIGPDELSRRVLEREINKLSRTLPLGYKAAYPEYDYSWMFGKKPMQYWLLGLIVLIIWAVCAILFESLIQPFVVISVIPLSFIGAFFTFYHFDIPFDEGGYASLLLLSGLVVNMAIYIINDMNYLRVHTSYNPVRIYLKAFNIKILPILLTTASTILGLLPFLVNGRGTSFWYALAAGTTGGLLFAIPVLILYLPLLMRMNLVNQTNPKQEQAVLETIVKTKDS